MSHHKVKSSTTPPIEIPTKAVGTHDSSDDCSEDAADQNHANANARLGSSAEGADQLSLKKRYSSTKESATRARKQMKTDYSSEQKQRKEERQAANRRSAHRSRQRRKILIEELEKQKQKLLQDRKELATTNEKLCLQLEVVMHENQLLRQRPIAIPGIPSSPQVLERTVVPQVAVPPVPPAPSVLDVKSRQEEKCPLSVGTCTSVSMGLSNQVVLAISQLLSQRESTLHLVNSHSVSPENRFNIQNQNIQLLQQLSTLGNYNDNRSTMQTKSLGSQNSQYQLASIPVAVRIWKFPI